MSQFAVTVERIGIRGSFRPTFAAAVVSGAMTAFYLATAEIGRILKGSDLWMDSDEIRRRLMRLQRARTKSGATRKKPGTATGGAV